MLAGTATGEEGAEQVEEEEEEDSETGESGWSCGRRMIGRTHAEGAEVSCVVVSG